MSTAFTRDVVHEIQAGDHGHRVDGDQPQEPADVEALDLQRSRFPVLRQEDRAYEVAADDEEEVDAHISAAGPLRPARGRDPDRFGRKGSEVEQDEVIGHHPQDGYRPDTVDDGIVERRAFGESLPVTSEIEQTDVGPRPGGRRCSHRHLVCVNYKPRKTQKTRTTRRKTTSNAGNVEDPHRPGLLVLPPSSADPQRHLRRRVPLNFCSPIPYGRRIGEQELKRHPDRVACPASRGGRETGPSSKRHPRNRSVAFGRWSCLSPNAGRKVQSAGARPGRLRDRRIRVIRVLRGSRPELWDHAPSGGCIVLSGERPYPSLHDSDLYRALPRRRTHWQWRHGRGVPRLRYAPQSPGRRQDAAAGTSDRSARRRTFSARGARRLRPQSSQHRHDPRNRGDRRWRATTWCRSWSMARHCVLLDRSRAAARRRRWTSDGRWRARSLRPMRPASSIATSSPRTSWCRATGT